MRPGATKTSEARLVEDLMERCGPLIGGQTLANTLGFPTTQALRKAMERGFVTVRVFKIEGRRGRFALTRDVAGWLAAQVALTQVSEPSDIASIAPPTPKGTMP